MLVQLTCTGPHAPDLGYLLHKHPDKVQSFDLSFGTAHVFYPVKEPERCQATLLVEVDPVGLVRRSQEVSIFQYVNDRPYVASSFLSVALSRVFGTALAGRCKERPELVDTPLPLEVRLTNVPCGASHGLVADLFEPLGYEVEVEQTPLDPEMPGWGSSRYLQVGLRATKRLTDVLSHVYVLVPTLDADKHYWVGEAEVDKLLRHGEGWLAAHPRKEAIAARYLKRRRSLVRSALERLLPEAETEGDEAPGDEAEQALERPISLNQLRLDRVAEVIAERGVSSVCDAGCGEGRLVGRLMKNRKLTRILGLDVSWRALELASRRLRLEELSDRARARVTLGQGSLLYRDPRLAEVEAVTLVEVIEHIEADRVDAVAELVLGVARPRLVVVSTPNVEHNVRFESLAAGKLRHGDHRFEWTREQFRTWCSRAADRFGYTVDFEPIGEDDPEVGPPTQMAIFEARGAEEVA